MLHSKIDMAKAKIVDHKVSRLIIVWSPRSIEIAFMTIFFIIEIIGYSSYRYYSMEFPSIKSKSKIAKIIVIHLQKAAVVTNTNSE